MHKCPIGDCKEDIKDVQIMCHNHWYTISHTTRLRVWFAHKDLPDSSDWFAAIADAIQEAGEIEAKRIERL